MLSLLDILFPVATLKLVKKLSPMKTIQPSINLWDTPEKYNGWADRTTWNCALWINNEQSIYNVAAECNDYLDFLWEMQAMVGSYATPDGADWGEANLEEMNELVKSIKEPIEWD
jgi:hypothetical protein